MAEERSVDVDKGMRIKKERERGILVILKNKEKIFKKILIFGGQKFNYKKLKNLKSQLHEKLNHVLKY